MIFETLKQIQGSQVNFNFLHQFRTIFSQKTNLYYYYFPISRLVTKLEISFGNQIKKKYSYGISMIITQISLRNYYYFHHFSEKWKNYFRTFYWFKILQISYYYFGIFSHLLDFYCYQQRRRQYQQRQLLQQLIWLDFLHLGFKIFSYFQRDWRYFISIFKIYSYLRPKIYQFATKIKIDLISNL